MNLRQKFIHWYYNEFHIDPLYLEMSEMSEDSPFHRERNIGVHTDMVVATYLTHSPEYWSTNDFVGALAAAFHDIGKPNVMEIAYKKERGNYKKFNGHEVYSARLWEDWSIRNWNFLEDVSQQTFLADNKLSVVDTISLIIYATGWIIEHHLPWKIKKYEKLHRLALTSNALFNDAHIYTNVLIADAEGRLCNDDKNTESHKWCNDFNTFAYRERIINNEYPGNKPVLYMPIGASGVGKSTYVKSILKTLSNIKVYSWDDLRLEWYINNEEHRNLNMQDKYELAFKRQVEDKDFNDKANDRFIEFVSSGINIIVDNTNLSKKRRQFFVDAARKNGYWIKAILFPTMLQTVIDRQNSRTDKTVPDAVVKQQYLSLQLPQYGEVDEISSVLI
jgi:predicted kinase